MKKLFFLLLALVATTSLWAHNFEVDGIYYNYLDGNNVEVTYLGDYYVSSLNEYAGEVIIPSTVTYNGTTYSVTSIGDETFRDCTSLTSVTIPNSVTSIENHAFNWCSSLTSVTIGNSVESIGEYAFYNCSSLTSITIPNSVESIGNSAFSGCSSLTSITIPNSVTSIGGWAFSGCSSLTTSVYNAHCFAYMPTTFEGAYVIPEGIKQIAGGAFRGCSSLTSIVIPNSVTGIGDDAFRNCSSLTSVTIPNSVTYIGNYAFTSCSSLATITIPYSVTSIGEWAFSSCSSLTSITIPYSVTSIGWNAFSRCSSLTSITCEATTPPTLGSSVFYGVSTSIPVYVPCGSENVYKAAYGWKEFTNIQEPQVEYAIQVSTSNSQMGTAIVDYNSCAGNQISATANIGYHFVQWSDGNTDNPRTIVLTQDTTLTAEFAPNTYTITTVSSDTLRGTTQGDTTVNYLENVTISATANYGYHFSHWNDYNYDNPCKVQVTEDKTYTAYFDKNTYYITKNYNSNQGYVNGSTSGEYLDNITLTAEPNCGYHFLQWSDGNTDNPRTITLTQDTVLTAEFAQSFSGQCGDNLYWAYNESDQNIAITGTGDMYNYTSGTQPWILFLEKIKKVTTDNTAASLGTSAFEGAIRLAEVHIGAKIDMIEANVFAGCDRLRNIYCYPTYPPIIRESSFARYDALLYIPCDYLDDYVFDRNWKKFENIQCAGAEKEEIESDDVDVDPSSTSVTMTWPTEENANTYTIEIMKGGALFCRLVFNTEGQLLNLSFAPGRDGNHPAQYAEAVANGGYRFTVTGLEEGTHYTYNIDVKNTANQTINSHTGAFTTQSTTAVDNITTNTANTQKLLRNGQLIILRDGVEYNAMGAEIQ